MRLTLITRILQKMTPLVDCPMLPEVVRVTGKTQESAVLSAKKIIEAGKVIALPTDTVYGLACDASNAKAIKRLYEIKGRDDLKPVAICVADIQSFRYWGQADHLKDDLLNLLLPGPITIVIEKSHNLDNPYLNTGTSKIGIRIPKFKFIQELCRSMSNTPLALTSANRSSEPSSLNIQEFKVLWPSLSGIFDNGQLGLTEESRLASTVVDLSTPGKYKIIREGVAAETTIQIMNRFNILPS